MKKLIKSTKGAGIAIVGDWILNPGEMPKQELTYLCWVWADDPQYKEVVAHMETLV